ncbi:MAG TPA: tetratricopeptide repeat protein [Kofleriaceae bacterium]|jgi:tetratricopeptide (TPR) repeat protein|nr:tetratricopeptide repeat protein [Kofleriaceae bacterium]
MIGRTVAIVATVTLATATARAEPEPEARSQAAGHVRQGQAFFQRGDFDRALGEYQTALDLSAEPSLVFNIALCHDRANRPEAALRAFQRYLELAPNGSVADEARADIARLTPIVEKITADRAAQQGRQREVDAQRAEADRRRQATLREAAADNRRTRIARYVLVGGGMAVGAGAITHFVASQTRDRVANDGDPQHYVTDRHSFVVQRDVAIGLYAAGTATLAVGLVLALTAHRASEGPQLSATLLPGGAAMTVAWSR